MTKMKVTNTKTEESIEVEGNGISDTTKKLVEKITEKSWDTDNLRFESGCYKS